MRAGALKQGIECHPLQISDEDDSEVDLQQICVSPISTEREPAGIRCFPVETDVSLPKYGITQAMALRWHIECNPLQLGDEDDSEVDPQLIRLSPISTEREPAGIRCFPVETDVSLPKNGITQARALRRHIERNPLQLGDKDDSEVDPQLICVPPISTERKPAGIRCFPVETDVSLPKYGITQARALRRHIERNTLQLGDADDSEVDPQLICVPPISTEREPAGIRCFPVETDVSLPKNGITQARALRRHIERNPLQLGDKDDSEVDPQLICVPPISTEREPAGIRCFPVETDVSLPKNGITQARALRRHIERNPLQLGDKDDSEVDPQLICVPPISTEREPAGIRCFPVETDVSLPKNGITQARALRRYIERNPLQLGDKDDSEVDPQLIRLPPISTEREPAGIRCFPVETDVSLPKNGITQARALRRHIERNTLQLGDKDDSEVDPQLICVPPISTEREPAGIRCFPVETDVSLPKNGITQARALRRYIERNPLQLGDKDDSEVDPQLIRLPPISTEREPAGIRCFPVETDVSLPKNGITQARALRRYIERNTLQLGDKDNSEVDLQPIRLPPISIKREPAGRRCFPVATDVVLPKYGNAKARALRHYIEHNPLQLGNKDDCDVDPQLIRLPPSSTEREPAGIRCFPVEMDASLPIYGNAQARALKRHIECNPLQLGDEDDSEVDSQLIHLPPISTEREPAGIRCFPVDVDVLLPKYGNTKARALRQYIDNNSLQLSWT
ncbi:hypothetical protein ABVT39_009579 [Epinephelus coioides]